jgi:hypothetical protein
MAGVLVTLAIAFPASAQGKSGSIHGKPPAAPPPTTTTVPGETAGSVSAAAPFAWVDDASLIAPGEVWMGISMVHWRGGGTAEMVGPVFDGAVGLTPRIQFGANVPRVSGGLGTTFFSTKISVLNNEARGVKLAAGPTLEILNQAAVLSAPGGRSRVQWGLPISVEFDRESRRLYGSSGYFSPGVWYAGAGLASSINNRVDISLSFSHASTMQPELSTIAASHRNDLSGSASISVTPSLALFGSLGRTLATSAQDGAGTTLSFGVSLNAGPIVLTK